MHRGEVWWAELPMPRGSEPGYRRPVLIIQTDHFNRSNISTIVVVSITSNLNLGQVPGNVTLPRKETGLSKDSVANVSQVLTFDKTFFVDCIGTLPAALFHKVEAGLRLILGL